MTLALSAAIAGALYLASGTASAEPAGSYRATCSGISSTWRTLSATCRTRDGRWNETELDNYRDCSGDIANINGELRCADDGDRRGDRDDDGAWGDRGDHGGRGDWTPRGSYHDSCRNEEVSRGTLTAECKDRWGRWRDTELDNFRSCRGDIYNDNGNLRCRRDEGDDEGSGPGGWERPRITLYRHSGFRGDSRSFDSDVPDLRGAGFSNVASSAYVRGGVWQLCAKPYYRGYCVTIDRNVQNFAGTGLNDDVESVRLLRRR
jgi:hypothetical protein